MGKEGGFYQREVVFPGALRLLALGPKSQLLDLACGQGAFAHHVTKKFPQINLTGMDISPSLIQQAKRLVPKGRWIVGDARSRQHSLPAGQFDAVACLLAVQNMDPLAPVFANAAQMLKPNAPFVIVMNHPAFRQPRQSSWGWDENQRLQYRRVDRYLRPYKVAIQAHPGADPSLTTPSFHRPLSSYVAALTQAGFLIDAMEEWVSPKTSDSGPRAKAENASRAEIPLFLALRAKKGTVK